MPTPKGIREGSIISARMQAFFAIVSRRPGAGRTPFPAVEPPFVPPPPPPEIPWVSESGLGRKVPAMSRTISRTQPEYSRLCSAVNLNFGRFFFYIRFVIMGAGVKQRGGGGKRKPQPKPVFSGTILARSHLFPLSPPAGALSLPFHTTVLISPAEYDSFLLNRPTRSPALPPKTRRPTCVSPKRLTCREQSSVETSVGWPDKQFSNYRSPSPCTIHPSQTFPLRKTFSNPTHCVNVISLS